MKITSLAFIDLGEESADTVHPLEICENLVKLGHQITMFTPSRSKANRELSVRVVNTGMFGIPLLKGVLHHVLLLPLLFVHSLMKRVDLIYSRYHPLEILATYPIKKIFGTKYIVEVNGAMKEDSKMRGEPGWKIEIYSMLEKRLFDLADKIVTVTDNLRNYLVREYSLSPSKIQVIPNGTNVDIFHPMDKKRSREKLDIPLESTVLCFVGSLRPWHGVENIIEILPELINRIPDLRLMVVGDGPLMKTLKQQVKALSIGQRVIFTGKIRREKVPLYINNSDICVAPFDSERNKVTGLSPLKVFDYMACGKPIIATDVGGLGKLIEKYSVGIVISPGNPVELAEAILHLTSDKELQEKLGRAGREIAVGKFSWQEISRKVEKVCKSTLLSCA